VGKEEAKWKNGLAAVMCFRALDASEIYQSQTFGAGTFALM